MNQCLPGCGVDCAGSSGANEAGPDATSEAADADGAMGDAIEANSPEATSMTAAAAQASVALSCYLLAGYEPDPCLPADDALLPLLSNVPAGCQAHVIDGPFASADQHGRVCCYSVTCR
jgi:hypothetical protein